MENHELHEREKQGGAQGTCAGASETDSLTSKLADSPVSESLTRSASGPASLPATSYSLPPACGVRRLIHQAATAPEALALDSPAEQGAALVTSLYRRYLPLIRYRQGDVLGGVRRLAHGHVASFERLQGRVNDMVVLEDGTAVHSVAVFHCTHQEPAVLNIQMVLEDEGPRILLVTRGEMDGGLEGRIRHRLGQIAPSLADAQIERAEDIFTTRAGKRRWVVDNRRKAEVES